MTHPTMATLTRLPRTPNIERATTPLGVPELGPLTASSPTSAQNRLPATITAIACQTLRPSKIIVPPSTM